jgi:hypothetical protein
MSLKEEHSAACMALEATKYKRDLSAAAKVALIVKYVYMLSLF